MRIPKDVLQRAGEIRLLGPKPKGMTKADQPSLSWVQIPGWSTVDCFHVNPETETKAILQNGGWFQKWGGIIFPELV